jgi:gliding motility-associated-like protein
MKLVFRYAICLLLTISLFGTSYGQIFRDNSNKAATAFKTTYSNDSIFIFHEKLGSLKARSPKVDPAIFQWSRFNASKDTVPMGGNDSIATNLTSGRYQVNIKATGLDTNFVAWVFIDSLNVSLKKTSKKEISVFDSYCDFLNLFELQAKAADFKYYNPKDPGKTLTLKDTIKYTWWDDQKKDFFIQTPTSPRFRVYQNDLPVDTVFFHVKGTNRFGLSKTDSAKYIPARPKSEFESKYDSSFVVDGKNSAPFPVKFTNLSKNGVKFTWFFGDGDSTTNFDKKLVVEHTYLRPDTLMVMLVSLSAKPYECLDSIKHALIIAQGQIGKDDYMDVPNVFTPNGDNINEFFKVYNLSIQHFKFSIFTRWGKKVYGYEGNDMLKWEGWDGNIGSSKASEGVYFYILEVLTWDRIPNEKIIHKKGI